MRMDIFSEMARKANGRTILDTAMVEIANLREQVEEQSKHIKELESRLARSLRLLDADTQIEAEVTLLSMKEKLSSAAEQVEKLTKERDTEIARNRPLQSLVKSQEEIKSFLLKKSEENKEAVKQLDSERHANSLLTEELAAIAEQNEKRIELIRRLYVELFYCDQQMTNTLDEEGEPLWQTGSTVRDVLRDAKELLPRAKADELEQSK